MTCIRSWFRFCNFLRLDLLKDCELATHVLSRASLSRPALAKALILGQCQGSGCPPSVGQLAMLEYANPNPNPHESLSLPWAGCPPIQTMEYCVLSIQLIGHLVDHGFDAIDLVARRLVCSPCAHVSRPAFHTWHNRDIYPKHTSGIGLRSRPRSKHMSALSRQNEARAQATPLKSKG